MTRRRAIVLIVCVLFAAGGGTAAWMLLRREPATVEPAPDGPVVEEKRPTVDAYGDPLPEGGLARLGTNRHRVPEARKVVLSPDGKVFAALTGDRETVR